MRSRPRVPPRKAPHVSPMPPIRGTGLSRKQNANGTNRQRVTMEQNRNGERKLKQRRIRHTPCAPCKNITSHTRKATCIGKTVTKRAANHSVVTMDMPSRLRRRAAAACGRYRCTVHSSTSCSACKPIMGPLQQKERDKSVLPHDQWCPNCACPRLQ